MKKLMLAFLAAIVVSTVAVAVFADGSFPCDVCTHPHFP